VRCCQMAWRMSSGASMVGFMDCWERAAMIQFDMRPAAVPASGWGRSDAEHHSVAASVVGLNQATFE